MEKIINVTSIPDPMENIWELNHDAEACSNDIYATINKIDHSVNVFNNSIKEVLKCFKENSNVEEAFENLCFRLMSQNADLMNLQKNTQKNLLKILTMFRDQDLNTTNRDAIINSNTNRIQSLETKNECQNDLKKVFIKFTCEKEIMALRSSNSIMDETKRILSRMEIDVSKLGIMPIKYVRFQHIRAGNKQIPALCIMFNNEKNAYTVRQQIHAFNAKLEQHEKLDEIRYTERHFWSKNIWRLLRICLELKRVGLIKMVRTHVDGILVQYLDKNTNVNHLKNMKVTCFDHIDKLRAAVDDIRLDGSCNIVYDDFYFKRKYIDRDNVRNSNDDDFELSIGDGNDIPLVY